MDAGRARRWSLDLRSFLLGCLTPGALVGALLLWVVAPWWLPLAFVSVHSVAASDLNAIGRAVGRFAEEHDDELPGSLDELVRPDSRGNTYLKSLPVDPWRRPYRYEPLEAGGARLSCLGEDGSEGTDDDVVFLVERGPAWIVREATDAELGRTRR